MSTNKMEGIVKSEILLRKQVRDDDCRATGNAGSTMDKDAFIPLQVVPNEFCNFFKEQADGFPRNIFDINTVVREVR